MAYQFKTIDNTGDTAFNQLLAINNAGTIAGYFGDGTILPNKGYTVTAPYTQAHFVNENFPTSVQTQVTGINNSGDTSGFWVDSAGNSYGFIDWNGTYSTALDPLAPLVGGVVGEQFLGLNDAGEVAGFYNTKVVGAVTDTAGFVYNINTGTYTAVTLNGATSVAATDINDKGQISGFFTRNGHTDGFVESNGRFLVLAGPAGGGWTDVQALGLNDAGLVVGSYVDGSGNTDGFVYDMASRTYTTVIDPNANGTTVVNGVNDQGQLVGFYVDAKGNTDGMLVKPGSQDFVWQFHTHDNAADPKFNQLLAINNAGVIAGYDGDGTVLPNKGYTLASPYTATSYTSENFPSSAQTQVTGINNAGETSGFWVDGNGDNFGFVDDNGRFITATDPAAPSIGGVVTEQFLGLNDQGEVAGFFNSSVVGGVTDTSAFIYNSDNGTFKSVDISGATSITASDINDRGDVSGFYTKGGVTDGFLEHNGKFTTLAGPTGAGWTDVQALGLNNADVVVGSYVGTDNNTHGFVYDNGSYNTLNAGSGVQTVINGINDLDQLVGFYMDKSGNTHGLMVTPQTFGATPSAHGAALGGHAGALADSAPSLGISLHPTGHGF